MQPTDRVIEILQATITQLEKARDDYHKNNIQLVEIVAAQRTIIANLEREIALLKNSKKTLQSLIGKKLSLPPIEKIKNL